MSKTRKRLFLVVLAALLAVLPAFADDVLYRTFPFAFQSAAAANGNGTANDVGALGTVVFVVTGTFSATVNFEATADNVRWDALQVSNISTGVTSNTATTPGTYWAPVAGLSKVRARVSNYASGTVTVTGRGAQARLNSPVASGGGGGGTTFPASADLSMGGYKLTNLADPTAGSQDAATAAFVQSQAAFVNVKATPGYDLLPAYTANGDNTVLTASANGALSIDYADLAVGDLVWLFYSAPVGIYEITALGDASHPWVLTRTAHSTPPVDGSFRTAIIYIYGGWYLQNSMWYYSVATGSSGWSPVFRDGQQVTKPGDIGTVQNGKRVGACPYYWSDGFLYGTPWWTKDTGQIANVADPVEAKDVANKEYVDAAVPSFVGAKVHRTGAKQSIPDSVETILQFTDEDYDQGNLVNLGTDNTKIVVATTGYYHIGVSVGCPNGGTINQLKLYVNGADTNIAVLEQNSVYNVLNCMGDVALTAGDYVQAKFLQNSGGSKSLDTQIMWIHKIR